MVGNSTHDSDEAFFENGLVGIIELSADDKVLRANQFICRLLQHTVETLRSISLSDITHAEDRGLLRDQLALARQNKTTNIIFEARLKKENGAYFPLAFSVRGTVAGAGLMLILTDLSPLRRTENALETATFHKELLEMSIGSALGYAIEARDPYTAGHQDKVTLLAGRIADILGLEPRQREAAVQAAAVHDIGKIGVPVEFLTKATKLSDIEMSVIRTHPLQGYTILKELPTDLPIADIVHQHHERSDGSGYPLGLLGPQIKLESSIVAAADIIDSVIRPRPYRAALPKGEVVSILRAEKDKGLPADIVGAAMEALDSLD